MRGVTLCHTLDHTPQVSSQEIALRALCTDPSLESALPRTPADQVAHFCGMNGLLYETNQVGRTNTEYSYS
jgi:hypothetical protein